MRRSVVERTENEKRSSAISANLLGLTSVRSVPPLRTCVIGRLKLEKRPVSNGIEGEILRGRNTMIGRGLLG